MVYKQHHYIRAWLRESRRRLKVKLCLSAWILAGHIITAPWASDIIKGFFFIISRLGISQSLGVYRLLHFMAQFYTDCLGWVHHKLLSLWTVGSCSGACGCGCALCWSQAKSFCLFHIEARWLTSFMYVMDETSTLTLSANYMKRLMQWFYLQSCRRVKSRKLGTHLWWASHI